MTIHQPFTLNCPWKQSNNKANHIHGKDCKDRKRRTINTFNKPSGHILFNMEGKGWDWFDVFWALVHMLPVIWENTFLCVLASHPHKTSVVHHRKRFTKTPTKVEVFESTAYLYFVCTWKTGISGRVRYGLRQTRHNIYILALTWFKIDVIQF